MADSDPVDQAAAIVDLMPRLMRRLFDLDPDDPTCHMPVGQLRVCGILLDCPRTVSALSRELGVSLSAATQLADRLVRSGMVERVAAQGDRRVKHLRLTASGEQTMRARQKRRAARVLEMIEPMSPESRNSVVTALRTLLESAEHGVLTAE